MSVEVPACEECGARNRAYAVEMPNFDVDECKECRQPLGPITKTFLFCSWLCLQKWVKKH